MKKTLFFAANLLLFGVGLLCFHLTAQSVGENRGRENAAPVSILDQKVENSSERELLELKIASHRKLADSISALSRAGAPAGNAYRLADAHANYASAEIELYQHTGEREKLRTALKAKVEALSDKLRAVLFAYEAATVSLDVVCATEIQLLDALLEQKRIIASLDAP